MRSSRSRHERAGQQQPVELKEEADTTQFTPPVKKDVTPEPEQKPDVEPEQNPGDSPEEPPAETPDGSSWPKGHTDPPGAFPVPEKPKSDPPPEEPDDVVGPKPDPKGWTDPPDAWPRGDHSESKKAPALVAQWKGDVLHVTRDGSVWRVKPDDKFIIRVGDKVEPKGSAEFTLMDGGLLRLDGELSFDGEPEALSLTLHDGALYADVTHELAVTSERVTARLTGVGVLEQRLHGFEVFCVSGSVRSGEDDLTAGYRARLEDDGFKHDKKIGWEDVQREFKFLRETPKRVMLHEDLAEAPGELFGGEIKDGVLVGNSDSENGSGFYLREPYEYRQGDVVRFRFRIETAREMILQFGTLESDNWRYKLGGVKAGEWIEYELPLGKLYKTTDVAKKAEPGLRLKFFQLHPEEGKTKIEIDSVEIVHQP